MSNKTQHRVRLSPKLRKTDLSGPQKNSGNKEGNQEQKESNFDNFDKIDNASFIDQNAKEKEFVVQEVQIIDKIDQKEIVKNNRFFWASGNKNSNQGENLEISQQTSGKTDNQIILHNASSEDLENAESGEEIEETNFKKIRPIIQVQNLVKDYGNFRAVNDISFEVKAGEIFGILGPNGAGKTTTMEIMEGILKKTSGKVLIDGLDIDLYLDQIRQIIGVQLQSSGFLPMVNLLELLNLFADIYNVEINAMNLLKKVNLADKAKSYVDQLSGGQKQRFSIATTLIGNPTIIFLDEPTTGLDPQARHNLWDMILDLKKQGKTIVLTTHYMDEAEILCDRIAIMDGGKIIQINSSEGFIKDLLSKGFVRPQPKLGATLEDVFLELTGKKLRE